MSQGYFITFSFECKQILHYPLKGQIAVVNGVKVSYSLIRRSRHFVYRRIFGNVEIVNSLNLIFPGTDGEDGNGNGNGKPVNEKETAEAVSFSGTGAYTSRLVGHRGLEPRTRGLRVRCSTN